MTSRPDPDLVELVPDAEERLRLVADAIRDLDATRARYMEVRQQAMAELRGEGWTLGSIARAAGINDKSHVKRIIDRGY